MGCCLRVTLLLNLFVIRSASGCNPVSEYEDRNVTTTTSNLIVYQLPSCPPLYHLNNIIDAQLSNPSTTSQPITLSITDRLNVCVRQNATPCSVDIQPQRLNVQGDNTILNVRVRYTCQLGEPGWLEASLFPKKAVEVSETSSVKYIRLKMGGPPMLWNCTVSSLRGSPVTWNWTSRNCAVTAFGCFSWNRAVVDLPVEKGNSLICLEPQSIGRILFVVDKYCGVSAVGIVIDLQVPLDSDFDITCSPQPLDLLNPNNNQQPNGMESDCSQMDWATRPLSSDIPSTASPSKGTTMQQGTTTVTETPVGVRKTDEQTGYTTPLASRVISSSGLASGVSLGLGIGLGLGLLLVLAAAIVIAVICVRRRKNRDFDASTSNLEKPRADVSGAVEDKDGGFVLANDIFTVHNIYSDAYDWQREETTEIGYGNESTPPAVTSPPPGDRKPKRATTLSRELFKQIAVIAKQEELRSQGSVEGEARGRPDGECSAAQGESQTSLVDRWLYSSTLNSAENTLNQNSKDGDGVYINRRFEMDI